MCVALALGCLSLNVAPMAQAATYGPGTMTITPASVAAGGARAPSAPPRWCILEPEAATPMKRTIQVRISRGDRQFVAECLDLPVVTQAATLDELAANIREAIGLHLEGEDLANLGFSNDPTILATMELESVA